MPSTVVGALKVLLQADTAQYEAKLKGADQSVVRLAERLKKDLEPSQQKVNTAVRQFLGTQEIGKAEAYARAVQQIGGANKLTEADQVRVNTAVKAALAHYRALGQEAPAHLKKLAADTKAAAVNTSQLGGAMSTMKGVLGAFGLTLGVSSLVSFGKSVFNAADQIGDLALKMGVSVEAAQRFQFAARQSGAEIEDVSRAIVLMNDKLAEGEKSTVAALEAAGLKFQDIRSMRPEDAFRTIADAIGTIPDPMRQTQVAMELFGKAGASILPMIREESLKAADGINVMSDETVRRLKDAQQAWENFWNQITIISGEAIVKVMGQWSKMIEDLRTGALFLARLVGSGGNAGMALQMGLAEFAAKQAQQQAIVRDLQNLLTKPGTMSSHGPALAAINTREQLEAQTRAAKALAETVKRLEEAYQKYKRELITGVTDAEREQLNLMVRLTQEGYNHAAVLAIQIRQTKELLAAQRQIQINTTPPPSSALNMGSTTALLAAGKPVDLGVPPAAISQWTKYTGLIEMAGDFMHLFGRNASTSTRIVMAGVQQTINGYLQQIASSKALTAAENARALASSAANAAMTMGLSLAVQFIIESTAKAKAFRAEVSRVTDEMLELGYAAEFVNDQLLSRRRPAGGLGAEDTVDILNDLLREAEERSRRANDELQDMTSALQRFGGVVPDALDPLLAKLGALPGTTDEFKAALAALSGEPSWEALQEMAESYGIALEGLGQKFQQAKLDSLAVKYATDFKFLLDQGADLNAVLSGMQDEVQGVVAQALKFGTAVPENMRDLLQAMLSAGLLTDEFGNALTDLSRFNFKERLEDPFERIAKALEKLIELLSVGLTNAATQAGLAFDKIRGPAMGFAGPVDTTTSGHLSVQPRLPSFAAGTHGQFMDFGPGTPVVLHGREAVVPEGSDSWGTTPTPFYFTFEMEGRPFARAVAPHLPGEMKRLGLTRF